MEGGWGCWGEGGSRREGGCWGAGLGGWGCLEEEQGLQTEQNRQQGRQGEEGVRVITLA